MPLLITRLRFQAPRVGELGVIPWVQILFFPLFSQLRRVKGGCVTLREEKFQEWIWWSWSNNSYYIYYEKVVGITVAVFPCVRKMTGPDTLFHQGDWKKKSFWLVCLVLHIIKLSVKNCLYLVVVIIFGILVVLINLSWSQSKHSNFSSIKSS